ncbi:MAG: LysR substrate-binding domain-containing protein [Alphaproteobacteria bacterium]
MRLAQIRDFLAIVDAGSIRAAARNIGASQPGLTKSVRSLEAELRVPLLERTSRGVVPTRYGHAFAVRARAMQTELRKAEEEIAQLATERVGSVAFGIGPAVAAMLIPEAIERFRVAFPDSSVRIVEGPSDSLLPSLRDGLLDFAIGTLPEAPLDPAYTFEPLFETAPVVVARKDHPRRNARTMAELADADWLGLPAPGLGGKGRNGGRPVPRAIVCEYFATTLALLTRTDMLAVVPCRWLAETPCSEDLVEIRLDQPMQPFQVGLITRIDTMLTPPAAGMVGALAAVARQPDGVSEMPVRAQAGAA